MVPFSAAAVRYPEPDHLPLIVIVVSFVAGFFFGKELQHKKDGKRAKRKG